MGAAEVTARSGTASPRCRCGHAKPRHDLPGFDGECVAEGCRCHLFSIVEIKAAPRHVPVALCPAERALVDGAWLDVLVAEIDSRPRRGSGLPGRRRIGRHS